MVCIYLDYIGIMKKERETTGIIGKSTLLIGLYRAYTRVWFRVLPP